MDKSTVAIGIAHNGVAQGRNGKDRQAFENLVHALLKYPNIPLTLCFYTEGVRWVTDESPYINELKEIRSRGADILVCKATLAESGMTGRLVVGRADHPDHIDDVLLQAEHAMIL